MAATKVEGKTSSDESHFSLKSIFLTKGAYEQVASEFHPFHKHDFNVFLHLWTTGMGIWGAVQMAIAFDQIWIVYAYVGLTAATCPLTTAALHTAMIYVFTKVSPASFFELEPVYVCLLAIALGYGLQDVSHWICEEKTFMNDYIATRPWMLLVHTLWLLPLVIDSVLMRSCFLPMLVNRNRIVLCQVASKKAVDDLRTWIAENVPVVKETTHVWPHKQEGTSGPTEALENDAAILAGFRRVFPAKHYDVRPVVPMNEIYVTAVGAKKEINSDAVFYSKHNDGPYWFLPCCSLFRVLVGVTHNTMVRTRFNLQAGQSENNVLDLYDVVGFDYNRELHYIDHVPGQVNKERRTLVKLHFIVYPKGWHRYGQFCADLNTKYNTWARNNFLQTLRPSGLYDFALAWWIWLTTVFNAAFEEHVGWNNLVYVLVAYALGPLPFLILTSFRHYLIYITTFAYRQPLVAHGFFKRDVLFYKTIAITHLSRRLLPMVELPRDAPGLLLALAGFSITMLATARLGMIRTYFGAELGFVKPKWITGFPYGYIPHPMIVGQLFAYGSILVWWRDRISPESFALVAAHMGFYSVHMIQEILTSSY